MRYVSWTMGDMFLVSSGLLLLVSLLFLAEGSTMVWNLSRVLYAIGVVLFLIDR